MGDKTKIEWTDEDWVPVPGWQGFEVTRSGRIRGPSGHELRPMQNGSGHLFVSRGIESKKLYVHRAVLLAFVGAPAEGQESRHLNGRPNDNRLVNLTWGDRFQQRADDRRNGVHRGRPQALSAEQAHQIRALNGTTSSRNVGRQFGVSHTAVLRIWRGKTWAQK
ncbi:hypothetical protein ES703_57692 [subsurface metagenome]